MAAKERAIAIKKELERSRQVSVSGLSCALGVTEETIRRDLEKLEGQGYLTRTHGGAVLNSVSPLSSETDFYQRTRRRVEEKQAIAQKALPLLEGRYAIAADSSTTALQAVKLLADRDRLSVLTYSAAIMHEMADSALTLVSTGGVLDKSTLSFTGEAAKRALGQYHVDIALFSCKGLHPEAGVLDSRENDAAIKRCLFDRAAELALLVDHTKFDRLSFVNLVSFDRIDYIVTDCEPSATWRDLCRAHGIELIY